MPLELHKNLSFWVSGVPSLLSYYPGQNKILPSSDVTAIIILAKTDKKEILSKNLGASYHVL